ncbi:hypothetical protein G3N58_12820 [Paraburkholderia sp. Ac-20342]|uniref:hypothetical protein n=1 Tax=Paraburkholderia sp. Ac-20342 TaxID=2703889 RepID=UPI00197E9ACC|nr:hypothetical protein [Paraburkholderia sp. Ac-20342]MBN3847701.1 hypothetical protein [Paraburkholderia sp. Ac-20342]
MSELKHAVLKAGVAHDDLQRTGPPVAPASPSRKAATNARSIDDSAKAAFFVPGSSCIEKQSDDGNRFQLCTMRYRQIA